MLMDLEPQEENPWLSQVEIWNKKVEIEKQLEEERLREEEERLRVKVREEEEEATVVGDGEQMAGMVWLERDVSGAVASGAITSGVASAKNGLLVPGLVTAPPLHQPIHFQYFNINNTNNMAVSEGLNHPNKQDHVDKVPPPYPQISSSSSLNRNQTPSLSVAYILYAAFLVASLSSLLLLTYHFMSSLHFDVKHKVEQQYLDQTNMVTACAQEWRINGCGDVAQNIPHMKSVCSEWEDCMRRDPNHDIDRQVFFFIPCHSIQSLLEISLYSNTFPSLTQTCYFWKNLF